MQHDSGKAAGFFGDQGFGPLQAGRHVAQCGEFGPGRGIPDPPRDGEGDRAPALAPFEQQARLAGMQRGPLRERRELGTVRGGVRPELGRAQRAQVLLEQAEPPPAGSQQPPPVPGLFRLQRRCQRARGAGEGRHPAARGASSTGEQPAGFRGRHPRCHQRDPAGQQPGVRGLVRAQLVQPGRGAPGLGQQPARRPPCGPC